MRNIRMKICYDGSNYGGFQYQDNTMTVQAVLNKALNRIFGEEVKIIAASRTDARVHALGQVINVRTNGRIPVNRICRAAASELPQEICVLKAEEVSDKFHARYDAAGKEYIYKIRIDAEPDPFIRNYCWKLEQRLDVGAMNEAVAHLCGTNDFSSFCAAGCSVKSMIRTVHTARWEVHGNDIVFIISGSGFLYNMVRIIVGTCVDVGRRRRNADDMPFILSARRRLAAGKTAPPQGLYLSKVFYREETC